ncbi:MAG: sulfurtransferase TusA family protein [Candidatus Lokiarchaeota archaeon]|nr:sulfurtransferase TusA family protein [Candidatus Lokiarchaeota archaeon]
MVNTQKLDLSGLVCPLPVAKTKRKLMEMQIGDILEVTGDFAEAGENIKRYLEKVDDKLLEIRFDGEHYYAKIQKA